MPATASSYDFEVNGIYYLINGNEVSVTYKYKGEDPYSYSNEYSGSVVIPSSVFYNGKNYSVTSIGGYAFYNCTELTSIEIPNSVTTIGEGAFYGCRGLSNVTIPNSVTGISYEAFRDCSGLTSITIPNSVTGIIEGAFFGCTGLTSVTIGNSVTGIGTYTFFGCTGLTSVTIGNSVTGIGIAAFYECSKLISIDIPNSVKQIGDEAFAGCTGLTSVTIGNSVSSFGMGPFGGCNELETITIDSENPYYDSRENCNAIIETATNSLIKGCKNSFIPNSVTTIGSNAFSGCSGLTNIEIPNSVTTIGHSAFWGCSGLTNIEIPDSVTSINSDTFCGCSGLTSCTIPNSVTYIGECAFSDCISLTNIEIPNSVTNIGYNAFSGCSNLTNVVIGKSTANIGERAFYNCLSITKVTSLNKVPPACSSNLFSNNVYNQAILYVPDVSVSEYILIDGWRPFIHIEGLETSDIVLANSITLDRQNMIIGVGTTSRLIATVLPDSATNKAVTWASSNPTIASVDDTGMVTAVALGSATITVMTTDGSNLSASCTVEVFNDMSQYSDYLSLTDIEAFHGDTIVIPVRMTNAANITAFQTDIFLPEGLEVPQEDGEFIIDPSARMTRTHSIMSSNVSNGAIRVLCYSSNYKPFTSESGDELFYITVKVADNAEGDYTIALKNTMLTNTDFVDIAAPDVAATINVKAYLPGDANDSGTVTVGDVVVTAQYVLELNPQPFNFEAADVNEDSYITVADVARIAWMVLNPTAYAPMRAPALWNNCDRMSGESIILMPGETRRVSITLDNEMAYTAFQLDLNLPEGLTANNFSLTDRADSHAFDINMLESGMMRILCYSPVLTAIGGHEGVLLTFDVTSMRLVNGDISVDGIELVTTGCQSVKLDGFAIGVNNASVVNELSAGKTIARVNYFNIAGQQIDSPENGVTLVVTTYTDGTRTTSKVIK